DLHWNADYDQDSQHQGAAHEFPFLLPVGELGVSAGLSSQISSPSSSPATISTLPPKDLPTVTGCFTGLPAFSPRQTKCLSSSSSSGKTPLAGTARALACE